MSTDADLLMLFDRLDKDKSKTLSLSELRRAFEKKGLSEKEVEVCSLSYLTLLLTSIVYEYLCILGPQKTISMIHLYYILNSEKQLSMTKQGRDTCRAREQIPQLWSCPQTGLENFNGENIRISRSFTENTSI